MSEHDAGPLFAVAAEAYDKLMGRYLPTLSVVFADAAQVDPGLRALDVGCGPGGLTTELVRRLGPTAVAAVDPSPSFVAACRERHPGVDVRSGAAEDLPWPDDEFDVTLGSLVSGFLSDPAGAAQRDATGDPTRRPGRSLLLGVRTDAAAHHLLASRVGDRPGRGGRVGSVRPPTGPAGRAARGDRTGRRDRVVAAGHGRVRRSGRLVVVLHRGCRSGRRPVPADDRGRTRTGPDRSFELLGRPPASFSLEAYTWCAVGSVPR